MALDDRAAHDDEPTPEALAMASLQAAGLVVVHALRGVLDAVEAALRHPDAVAGTVAGWAATARRFLTTDVAPPAGDRPGDRPGEEPGDATLIDIPLRADPTDSGA